MKNCTHKCQRIDRSNCFPALQDVERLSWLPSYLGLDHIKYSGEEGWENGVKCGIYISINWLFYRSVERLLGQNKSFAANFSAFLIYQPDSHLEIQSRFKVSIQNFGKTQTDKFELTKDFRDVAKL